MHPHWIGLCVLAALTLSSCATDINVDQAKGTATLGMQSRLLNPSNGGQLVGKGAMQPGDILLSSVNSLSSLGIRALSLSPVSHASIYLGDGQVAEAVTSGIRIRSVDDFVAEESTIVAFRHPGIGPAHLPPMRGFVDQHVGQKYNFLGIVLQAPFTLERRVCELPLVPALVRDFCVQGLAAVHLGLGSQDKFFCSQFVLQAYLKAGLPLTDADPRLFSPDDLLRMREGDVSAVKIKQALQYVGHLKMQPLPTVEAASVALH
ncbi:MAG: distant relative of cell wall-associated hydrolase [Burkholderiaceae bacterium]